MSVLSHNVFDNIPGLLIVAHSDFHRAWGVEKVNAALQEVSTSGLGSLQDEVMLRCVVHSRGEHRVNTIFIVLL